jgi:hypothetical protein
LIVSIATNIHGYRVVEDRALSVLASTSSGWETRVSSVKETSGTLIVAVATPARRQWRRRFPST